MKSSGSKDKIDNFDNLDEILFEYRINIDKEEINIFFFI